MLSAPSRSSPTTSPSGTRSGTSLWDWIRQFALLAVIAGLFIGGLATWVLIAVTGYVVQWWNFRLVRERGPLHLSAGLFTTRSITVEEPRSGASS